LYAIKTPFYLGDFDKALSEADQLEISKEDSRNQLLRNLFIVRALTAKSDFQNLKAFMTGLMQDSTKQGEVANHSLLAQFIAQRVTSIKQTCRKRIRTSFRTHLTRGKRSLRGSIQAFTSFSFTIYTSMRITHASS
jgi:hypothetical protein